MRLVERTRVSGWFEGWVGATVVKLANGESYQQDQNYSYVYRVLSPSVDVYEDLGSYFLEVEGTNTKVRVRRM